MSTSAPTVVWAWPSSDPSSGYIFENADLTYGHLRGSAVIRRGVPPNIAPLTSTTAAKRHHRRQAEPLPWDGASASDPVSSRISSSSAILIGLLDLPVSGVT